MPSLFSILRSLLSNSHRAHPADDDPVVAPGGQGRRAKPNAMWFRAQGDGDREFAIAGRRRVVADDLTLDLDLASQVLKVELPDSPHGGRRPVRLIPRLKGLVPDLPVSASALGQKAKLFDDGLLAAVELATQEGAGRQPGKAALLSALGRALAVVEPGTADGGQALILGAARLGEVPLPALPPRIESLTERSIQAFLADDRQSSRPLGFYTWSQRLTNIFRQDRMLQRPLESRADIDLVARALRADPSARAAYESLLALSSRLTNPLSWPDLRGVLSSLDRGEEAAPDGDISFFPPSRSHEADVGARLCPPGRAIPADFVLIDAMIRLIRAGELDLTPKPDSGWYDYQTWALEPLVAPERTREAPFLVLAEEYRALLLELFKGLLALTAETHVKERRIFTGEFQALAPTRRIVIKPALAAEPLPTFYLRRALGYRYVRGVLEEAFGADELTRMHRLGPDGAVEARLSDELTGIEALFLGAHVVVSRQLGLAHDPSGGDEPTAEAAARAFLAWRQQMAHDPDLSADLRAMVPVFYDDGRKKMKVWVFLGWDSREIEVSFNRPPAVTVLEQPGGAAPGELIYVWGTLSTAFAYPVTGELYVDRLLDRDEFRRVCDAGGTREGILRLLAS